MGSKTEQLKFKVLVSDKHALKQIAQIEGESMSVVIRNLIRQRARELGFGRGPPGTELRDEGRGMRGTGRGLRNED